MSWPLVSLESLLEIKKGKKHEPCEIPSKLTRRFLQIDDLRNDNKIKYTLDKKGVFADKTDVIIAWDGANAGTIGFGKEGLIGSTLAKLSFDLEQVNTEYLGRFLQSKFRELRENCTGATIPHISKPFLVSLKIPLPPLETQKQIAAVLEKADQLRKDCKLMEQELNSLAQSVFIDMFGDPVTNPKGWEIRELGSLIVKGDRINYGVVQPGQFETAESGIPLIRISDFYKGGISLEKIKYISSAVDNKYKKSKIIGDEVLIACVGATIGKTAIVTKKHSGYNIARAVTRVRVDETINRYFLQKYLESDFIQSFFIKETRSVGQPTLNTSLIAKAPILIPDEKTQNLFLKFSELNDVQINYAKFLANEYEQQFTALLAKAFKGELNLKTKAA